MPGRPVPARGVRERSAIIAPYTDRRPITASPSSPSGRWKTSRRACPAATATITRATSKPSCRAIRAWCAWPRSTRPTAIPIGRRKFTYKLGWLDRLAKHAKDLLANEEPVALMGDFNVIPEATRLLRSESVDEAMRCSSRNRARRCGASNISATPMPSAPATRRRINTRSGIIRRAPGSRNNGIRIDHILLSPQAADRLKACAIDKHVRGQREPVRPRAGVVRIKHLTNTQCCHGPI